MKHSGATSCFAACESAPFGRSVGILACLPPMLSSSSTLPRPFHFPHRTFYSARQAAFLARACDCCANNTFCFTPQEVSLSQPYIPHLPRDAPKPGGLHAHIPTMQSSPPYSAGKARAIRELSQSLNHSQRSLSSVHSAPSDSNPTKRSGFGDTTDDFFNDPNVLMSTQHNIDDETNTLPRYPRIRSTAKKATAWRMPQPEINPDTSMVNKEFGDFDHSISDDEVQEIEQARGDHQSNRGTPARMSSHGFDSLYDITPPTGRSRKSNAAETGSLRRDAQIRRASRNDRDNGASPRPGSTRNSPALSSKQERKRASLAQLHAKLSEDESSFMQERPPTTTFQHSTSTRWGNPRSRQTSLQMDGYVDASQNLSATRPATAQNPTAQSFILPDLPNLTELVSGVFEDGTPVFSKNAPMRLRSAAPGKGANGGRQPSHIPVDSVPIPKDEKAIFAALQLLQDKVAQMEHERAEQDKKIEDQELEIVELKASAQNHAQFRRSDSALGSTDGEGSGKASWKVEKTRMYCNNPC